MPVVSSRENRVGKRAEGRDGTRQEEEEEKRMKCEAETLNSESPFFSSRIPSALLHRLFAVAVLSLLCSRDDEGRESEGERDTRTEIAAPTYTDSRAEQTGKAHGNVCS